MLYFVVSLAILAYAVYKAAQKDFTYGRGNTDINPDKLMPYIIATLLSVLAWPIVIPLVGIYRLGERFKKEK
jgi:hypothetical protein